MKTEWDVDKEIFIASIKGYRRSPVMILILSNACNQPFQSGAKGTSLAQKQKTAP